MISFNLTCGHGHSFEGWFKSSAEFDDQKSRGFLSCPICDDTNIAKGLMAPNVTAKSNTKENIAAQPGVMSTLPAPANPQQQMQKQAAVMAQITPEMAEAAAEALAQMRKVQNKIVETCDDVGDAFAEEARKIHYGEAEDRDLSRGIYGNATEEEAEALHEEGIEIVKMTWLPKEQ